MEVSDQSVHAEVEALGSHIGDTLRINAPSHHLPTPRGSEKHNNSLTHSLTHWNKCTCFKREHSGSWMGEMRVQDCDYRYLQMIRPNKQYYASLCDSSTTVVGVKASKVSDSDGSQ